MKISIIGCGWFGSELAQKLIPHHEVYGTSRSLDKLQTLIPLGLKGHQLIYPQIVNPQLLQMDAVVINFPPFEGQLDWLKNWKWSPHSHIIFISSTSIYGDDQGLVTEETTPHPNTIGGALLVEEEKWASSFPNYTIIRFGGLIGKERHPGKFLQGKVNIPNGNWPVNVIHLDDTVGFTELVIEKKIHGLFNLVSDQRQTREQYYTHYCKINGLPLPSFNKTELDGKVISNEKIKQFYKLIKPQF